MTLTHNDNETILGRSEINDIDAILAIPTTDPSEVQHVVKNNADSIFTWDYSLTRPPLRKLYEKAKVGQWNSTTDLPWHLDVDVEKCVIDNQAVIGRGVDENVFIGTPVQKWGDKEWLEFGVHGLNWQLSQFLHGEQGALICTAKIVETPSCTPAPRSSTKLVTSRSSRSMFALSSGLRVNGVVLKSYKIFRSC